MKQAILSFFLFCNTLLSAQVSELRFLHYWGSDSIVLDEHKYRNNLGQQLIISKIKYYIGNLRYKANGKWESMGGQYFLIDQDEQASQTCVLPKNIQGNFDSLSFTLGVDSIWNVSGAQTGPLDPKNGMFWEWKTGYVHLKLEGISDASTAVGGTLEYHLGGSQYPYSNQRLISLGAPKHISNSTAKHINIGVDFSRLLVSENTSVDFKKLPVANEAKTSFPLADNAVKMFFIE